MSLYLQRLARPSPPSATLVRPGGRVAPPGPAAPGVQEIEQVVETHPPGPTAVAQADPGQRPGRAPAQGPATRATLTDYVTRWLAGPGGVHSQTTVPGASPASFDVSAATVATPPGTAVEAATGTAHEVRAGAVSPTDHEVAVATPWGPAAFPPGALGLPSMPSLAAPFAAGIQPPAETAVRNAPEPHATPGSHATAVHRPAGSLAIAARSPAPPVSRAARALPPGRQVEVHIGSIALTVKVPPNVSPANPSAAATSTARAVTAASPGTAHPRAAAAEPLRFSPARHHLRWS